LKKQSLALGNSKSLALGRKKAELWKRIVETSGGLE